MVRMSGAAAWRTSQVNEEEDAAAMRAPVAGPWQIGRARVSLIGFRIGGRLRR